MKTVGPERNAGNAKPPIARLLRLPATLVATAAEVYPNPSLSKDRLSYIISGLAHARLTASWFQLLQEPGLASFAQLNPRILSKLQRPYLQSNFQPVTRFLVLQEHYRFALNSFATTTFPELLKHPGIILADIPISELGHYSLRLLYANKYEKEGELTLALYDEDRREFMFALSFCVSSFTPNPRLVFIGGLQGNQVHDLKSRVVAVTRAMHGLRPKALLVFALQQLAEVWKIPAIEAVGNMNAVFRHPWLGDHGIHANHDRFWLECGGQQGNDGNFILPPRFVPRDLCTLIPSKRALYRRRYEMLADLSGRIQQGAFKISAHAQE